VLVGVGQYSKLCDSQLGGHGVVLCDRLMVFM